MNPPPPKDGLPTPPPAPSPREELEARLAALVLGEAGEFEAETLRARLATDPDLAALHRRLTSAAQALKDTFEDERTAAALPSGPAAPAQLSPERRAALAKLFNPDPVTATTSPAVESAAPATVTTPTRAPARRKSPFIIFPNLSRQFIAAAAVLLVAGLGAYLAIPSFSKVRMSQSLTAHRTESEGETTNHRMALPSVISDLSNTRVDQHGAATTVATDSTQWNMQTPAIADENRVQAFSGTTVASASNVEPSQKILSAQELIAVVANVPSDQSGGGGQAQATASGTLGALSGTPANFPAQASAEPSPFPALLTAAPSNVEVNSDFTVGAVVTTAGTPGNFFDRNVGREMLSPAAPAPAAPANERPRLSNLLERPASSPFVSSDYSPAPPPNAQPASGPPVSRPSATTVAQNTDLYGLEPADPSPSAMPPPPPPPPPAAVSASPASRASRRGAPAASAPGSAVANRGARRGAPAGVASAPPPPLPPAPAPDRSGSTNLRGMSQSFPLGSSAAFIPEPAIVAATPAGPGQRGQGQGRGNQDSPTPATVNQRGGTVYLDGQIPVIGELSQPGTADPGQAAAKSIADNEGVAFNTPQTYGGSLNAENGNQTVLRPYGTSSIGTGTMIMNGGNIDSLNASTTFASGIGESRNLSGVTREAGGAPPTQQLGANNLAAVQIVAGSDGNPVGFMPSEGTSRFGNFTRSGGNTTTFNVSGNATTDTWAITGASRDNSTVLPGTFGGIIAATPSTSGAAAESDYVFRGRKVSNSAFQPDAPQAPNDAFGSPGVVLLNGALNTYNGTTAITAGTLRIGNGSTAGTVREGTVALDGDRTAGGIQFGNGTANGTVLGAILDNVTNDNVYFNGPVGSSVVGAFNGSVQGGGAYYNGDYVAAGDMNLGNGAASGTVNGAVRGNASLAFNHSSDITYSGIISGNGSLTQVKVGDGTMTFQTASNASMGGTVVSANNTYTGGTTITAGTMSFSNSYARSDDTAATSENLVLGNSLALQNSTLNKQDDGGLSFGTLNNMTLGGLSGNKSLALSNVSTGSVNLTIGNNNTNATYSGNVSGSGSLAKNGTGVFTVMGDQTYTGETRSVSSAEQVALTVGSNITVAGSLTKNGTSSLTLTGVNIYSGTLSPDEAKKAEMVKDGAGSFTLTGTNTYNGSTTANGGAINFSTLNNFGKGNVILSGGGLQWAGEDAKDMSSKPATEPVTFSNVLSLADGNADSDRNLILNGGTLSTTSSFPALKRDISLGSSQTVEQLLERGRAQYLYGDYSAAQKSFDDVIAQDPNNRLANAYQKYVSQIVREKSTLVHEMTREDMLLNVDYQWRRPIVYAGNNTANATEPAPATATPAAQSQTLSANGVFNTTRNLATTPAPPARRSIPAATTPAQPPPPATDQPVARPPSDVKFPAPVPAASNAFSTFSLNVSDVAYRLALAALENRRWPDPSAVRTEEFLNAFNYHDAAPRPGQPAALNYELAQNPFESGGDLLRVSFQTAAAGRDRATPLRLTIVLDGSGSMTRADRVAILQAAIRALGRQLRAGDAVSLVMFARTAQVRAIGVPAERFGEIARLVDTAAPDGGTNIEEALMIGYQIARETFLPTAQNRVILLTDGAANLGQLDPKLLAGLVEENRRGGIALDAYGVGWDGYDDTVLEALTRNSDGRYGFLNRPEDVDAAFAAKLAGALAPAAADVKLQIEFNPNRVASYRLMGYNNQRLTKEQFRDNTVNAAEMAAAEQGTALYNLVLKSNGTGPIGVARARFRDPATNVVRELSWPLRYEGTPPAFDQAAPSMRLAATAAYFAEYLQQSPFAAEVTPRKLMQALEGVPDAFAPDPRPAGLANALFSATALAGN